MRKALRMLMVPLLLGLAACTGVPEPMPPLQIQDTAPPVGIYYQGAVKAILRRDYATALDYLQAARAADPQDVPTLNAFGVVYDKLGRFDLSRRYYAQAAVRDPSSRVVAANMAYSRMLEATEEGGLPPPEAAPGPAQTVVTIPAMPIPKPELPKIRIAQLERAPPARPPKIASADPQVPEIAPADAQPPAIAPARIQPAAIAPADFQPAVFAPAEIQPAVISQVNFQPADEARPACGSPSGPTALGRVVRFLGRVLDLDDGNETPAAPPCPQQLAQL